MQQQQAGLGMALAHDIDALDRLDMSEPHRFVENSFWPLFARMRRDAPLHHCPESSFGPFWSVTRYDDIMRVDTDHKSFSSEPAITLINPHPDPARRVSSFIAADQPRHTEQRKAVNPVVGPANLAAFEALIRQRSIAVIESLPVGETFDWVERVSIELTTQMLATLFNFPFEDRHLLTHWSDQATTTPPRSDKPAWRAIEAELQQCLAYFERLWAARRSGPPAFDFVSMMAQSPATANMSRQDLLGNLILLIVGGNDTTRNSISGGLYFLHNNPREMAKVRADRALIPNMVAEIIRYQTPLAYMARRAKVDVEMHGKTIRAGDKIAMWYISGNRDDAVFDQPDTFRIDRDNARRHLSFGFGIHRCMGNRLAELQLRILWEELLNRTTRLEVMVEPTRVASSFVHGYAHMPVRLWR
jgi:cytochrome P450